MKKYRNIMATVLLSLTLIFALVGCSQPAQTNDRDANSAAATTLDITDAYGRTVTLPVEVDSVATVGSGARFVVYAGAQDKLIAVTDSETKPSAARPYTLAYESLFTTLPSTSNGNHLMDTNVNTEQLLSLHPDVIVSSRSAEECDDLQNAIGIPVVGISYQDQLFSDDVYTSIEVVGEALGTSDHADAVVAKMKSWARDLDDRTESISDANKPTCYVGAVNYKGAKSFGGTYAAYAPLDAVNAINVADEIGGTGSLEIDLEQLGEWDPDFMFLNAGNMNLMKQDYADNTAFFDSLTAFKTATSTPAFVQLNGTTWKWVSATLISLGHLYPDAFPTLIGTMYDGIPDHAAPIISDHAGKRNRLKQISIS